MEVSDSAESRLGGSRIATRLTSDRHAPLSSQTAIYMYIYIYIGFEKIRKPNWKLRTINRGQFRVFAK